MLDELWRENRGSVKRLYQTSMPSFSPLLTLWQVPGWVCLGSHGWVARVAGRGNLVYSTTNDPQNGQQMIDNGDHLWSGDHLQSRIICSTVLCLQSSCTCRCCLVSMGNKWGSHTSIHPDISCCTINAVAKMKTRILEGICVTYNG